MMNSNDPVMNFLKRRLLDLSEQYKQQPDEASRYRLATHEELIRRYETDHNPVIPTR